MSRASPPPRGGIGGLVLLFCLTAAIVGLAFDFGAAGAPGFWIGARAGGHAVIGAAAAVFCLIAGYLARIMLGRGGAKRSGDADPHA